MKRVILLFGILFTFIGLQAQEIDFTLSGPEAVSVSSQFRIVFSINAEAKDFQMGELQGFDILSGPSTSRSQSMQMMGGKTEKTVSTTYTYVLQATKESTLIIPAATVTVDGKEYKSNSLTIKVMSEVDIDREEDREIFIRAISGNTTIHEHEPVLVTFKVYARGFDISRWNVKLDANGFLLQDINLSDSKYRQWTPENYDGKTYNTVILKQTLFYPQHSGGLEIGKGEFDLLLHTVSKSTKGNQSYIPAKEVRKTIYSSPVKVNVKSLPNTGKPQEYANAVGNFTIQSDINMTTVKINQPLTIKIELSGAGNFALIKDFEVAFPTEFEAYRPKVEQSLKVANNGQSGTKTFQYLAIPRKGGTYTIPAIEFSYFDPAANAYKTLRSKSYKVKVEKGTAEDTYALGMSLAREGKYDKAREQFESVIDTERNSPLVVLSYLNIGDTYMAENNYDESIKAYQEALRLDPENKRAYDSLMSARALQKKKKNKEKEKNKSSQEYYI